MEGAVAAFDAKWPACRDADTRTVRLSRDDILVLVDVLAAAVASRTLIAQGIEDDATGARSADPEWADVLERQARHERARATHLTDLRTRIGAWTDDTCPSCDSDGATS